LIVWAIPALVILFLAGIAWVGSHQLDPPRALHSNTLPLEVQVVSLDWQWLFIYPGATRCQPQPPGDARRRAREIQLDLRKRH